MTTLSNFMPSSHRPASTLSRTPLGRCGPQAVSRIGLGCMGISGMYGASDDAPSIATIHAVLDAGINLLDAGDFYGFGHNESLIGQALKGLRDDTPLSVKFGALRDPGGKFIGVDGRAAAVKNFLTYTLQRLGTDHIDIYCMARLDPSVPVEETSGTMAELVQAGYARSIGLSEVGVETIKKAHAVPGCRSADRVFAHQPQTRGRNFSGLERTRHRRYRIGRAVARAGGRLQTRIHW